MLNVYLNRVCLHWLICKHFSESWTVSLLCQEARNKAAQEKKRREDREKREREAAAAAQEKLEEIQRKQNEEAEKVWLCNFISKPSLPI